MPRWRQPSLKSSSLLFLVCPKKAHDPSGPSPIHLVCCASLRICLPTESARGCHTTLKAPTWQLVTSLLKGGPLNAMGHLHEVGERQQEAVKQPQKEAQALDSMQAKVHEQLQADLREAEKREMERQQQSGWNQRRGVSTGGSARAWAWEGVTGCPCQE